MDSLESTSTAARDPGLVRDSGHGSDRRRLHSNDGDPNTDIVLCGIETIADQPSIRSASI